MARASGFTVTAQGWRDPFIARKPKRRPAKKTPEQIEANRASMDALVASFLAEQERRSTNAKARAITKIEDRKARAAVEGDTDLNHDNLEAAE